MIEARAERVRRIVLVTWALLALTLLAWFALLLPAPAALLGTALVVLPLAWPVRGLLRRQRRSYRWAPFTLAPALGWSLTEFVAHPAARPYALSAACLVFVALAAVVAWLRVSQPR